MRESLPTEYVENVTFDEISIGQSAKLIRTLTVEDIQAFAAVSGDTNAAHLDINTLGSSLIHEVVGHGMWSASLISALLGTQFPGSGTIYRDQTLHFKRAVRVGDTITVVLRVLSKDTESKSVNFECLVTNQNNEQVVIGKACILAPTIKVRTPKISVPQIRLFDPDLRLKNLLAMGQDIEAVTCGVVHPCDEDSLKGAIEAAEYGLINPILIGPSNKILEIAEKSNIDIKEFKIISVPHSHAAADLAANLAAEGTLEALMKGSLHTDELMHAVIANKSLRTKRRLSHVFRFEVPLYDKPILISDAALNIRPTLSEKVDIVQNTIDLSHIMGRPNPKVAILSAVETINPDIPSTLDAAALCKMADRGQIKGGQLDGPLAFDNAVSPEAVRIKKIHSIVAGDAEILIVPDLESGNMLSKQLEYLGGATACGVVLGCKVPIALTSRADGPSTRIGSALLAKLIAHHYRQHRP